MANKTKKAEVVEVELINPNDLSKLSPTEQQVHELKRFETLKLEGEFGDDVRKQSYNAIKDAHIICKNTRTNINKLVKETQAPAKEFIANVKAKGEELTNLVKPIEDKLYELRGIHEAELDKIAQAKKAEEEAKAKEEEEARNAELKAKDDYIKKLEAQLAEKEEIKKTREDLEARTENPEPVQAVEAEQPEQAQPNATEVSYTETDLAFFKKIADNTLAYSIKLKDASLKANLSEAGTTRVDKIVLALENIANKMKL